MMRKIEEAFRRAMTRELDVLTDPQTDQQGWAIANARLAALRELKQEIEK